MSYAIEGRVNGQWHQSHVGAGPNAWETRELAEAELPELAETLECDVSELRVVVLPQPREGGFPGNPDDA